MFINRFWAEASEKFKHPNTGEIFPINVWGGSIKSESDARSSALKKIELIKKKIMGDYSIAREYKAEIREEIIEEIDSNNVVTLNRYGAKVLNSKDTVFIDIDEPKRNLFNFFKTYSLKEKKKQILQQVLKATRKKEFQGLGFRIYETNKGFRVIVLGIQNKPNSPQIRKIFKTLNSDRLYSLLCRKQDCYRARISPKPGNMKYPKHRVRFPTNCTEEKNKLSEWLEKYALTARDFKVCSLRESVGIQSKTSIVQYHDDFCGVNEKLPLA